MLEFSPLGKNVEIIKDYMQKSPISFCDLSVGVKYMWRDDFKIDYAFVGKTLIMKETCADYENAFYFPIGDDVDGAFSEIEEYCKKTGITLKFCCIDNRHVGFFADRYRDISIYNLRDWSDYIYDAEKFKTYSGKKFSGQRNHVNKFKKLYPGYVFAAVKKDDFPEIYEFLKEYEKTSSFTMWSAFEEEKKVYDLVEHMFELGLVGGVIRINGRIAALSVGEKVGDTLVVHVEKALTRYEGIYPAMASEFAKAFACGVKYINREEDCGDDGLRISKLQYHPVEVKEKNIITVRTLFDAISAPVLISTERLTITDIMKDDADEYFDLYTDEKLNVYWGYDYKEDLTGEATPAWFFAFQKALKDKKEEYSLAVRLNGRMIGELVLHNFDYFGGVEMGFRFFKEYQGKGYAFESASALKNYVFNVLKAQTLKSRCFKQNVPSRRLIEKLGLKLSYTDDTHFYFKLNR